MLWKLSLSWKSNIVLLESLLYVLLVYNPFFVIIGNDTRTTESRRLDEDIANKRAPPKVNQVRPLKEYVNYLPRSGQSSSFDGW